MCNEDTSSVLIFSKSVDTICNSDDDLGRIDDVCSFSVSENDAVFVGISTVVSSNGFSIQQSSSSVSFSSSLKIMFLN